MSISHYTDRVDANGTKKAKRIHLQLQEICAALTGLIAAIGIFSVWLEKLRHGCQPQIRNRGRSSLSSRTSNRIPAPSKHSLR